jgi:hypothetical protein
MDMVHRRIVPGGDGVRLVWDTSGTLTCVLSTRNFAMDIKLIAKLLVLAVFADSSGLLLRAG